MDDISKTDCQHTNPKFNPSVECVNEWSYVWVKTCSTLDNWTLTPKLHWFTSWSNVSWGIFHCRQHGMRRYYQSSLLCHRSQNTCEQKKVHSQYNKCANINCSGTKWSKWTLYFGINTSNPMDSELKQSDLALARSSVRPCQAGRRTRPRNTFECAPREAIPEG